MRLALGLLLALLASAPARAQLSGTYTIGGASPDYAGIPAAVADLVALGVSGNVIFQIRPGTYNPGAGIDIGPIPGVSASAQVRFEAADPANRPLLRRTSATSGSNFVVRFNGADWVTLKNLDFEVASASPVGRLVVLADDASNVTIRGCTFTGHPAAGSDEGSLIWSDGAQTHDNLTVDQNTFSLGWKGIDMDAPFADKPTGLAITGNTFSGQEMEGIDLDGDGFVQGNTLTDAPTSDPTYRAIVTGGGPNDAMQIVGNTVEVRTGSRGISGLQGTTLITNNLVSIRASSSIGSGIYSTGGLVAHNTMYALGLSAVLDLPPTGNATVEIRNNILIVDGTGAAIEDPGGNSILASSDNLLYTTSGALIEWEGATYATLAAWQATSGFDAGSISLAPTLLNVGGGGAAWDLHLAGASLTDPALIAPPLADVTTDVDGSLRDPFNPKRGAHEGTLLPPLDNADVVAGFYAVAGASPDFADPDDALAALAARGMKGAVTFRIRTGTFTVRETLREDLRVGPAAADPAATPLIVRAANPASRPTLVSGGTTTFNWLLRLRGLDHVTLENLDFDASAAGDAGRLLVLEAGGDGLGSDDVTLAGCTFAGAASGVATDERALVWGNVDAHDRLSIAGSTFTGGWAGVYFNDGAGASGANLDGVFSSNVFDGQTAYGLFLADFQRVVIDGNTITSSASSTNGLHLAYNQGYTVTGNQIALTASTADGIVLLGPDPGPTGTALVANNFVRAQRPIRLSTGTSGARIVHNTLYASGLASIPLTTGSLDDEIAELTNNILYNATGGPALRLAEAASLVASNGNVFWSAGGSVLMEATGTTYATLADWQAASGLDARSRSFNVSFQNAGTGDLHLAGASISDPRFAGLSGTGIETDLDGETRNADNPTIGADEATPLLPLAGVYTVGSEPGAPAANFATLASAIERLDLLGVSASVTLRLYADPVPLTGPFTIGPIDGTSATDRVTFISYLPINTLRHNATQPSNNWVVRLDGARHLTFSDLAFDASGGTAPLGRTVLLAGDVQDVRFVRTIHTGIAGATDPLATPIWSSGATLTGIVFEDGQVNGGSSGIALDAASATGTLVDGITILGQTKDGIALTGHTDPIVRDVTVTSTAISASASGILLTGGDGGAVSGARVTVSGGFAKGLTVTDQNGAPGDPVRIVNNFLTASTNGAAISASEQVSFFHNSVRSTGGTGSLFVSGSADVRIANNILSNSAGGRVLNITGLSGIAGSDYNALVSPGAPLTTVDGVSYATLAAHTAGTALDAHSNTPAVVFANAAAGDLHLSGASVGDAALGALPLGSVSVDIDQETRSTSATYKGADEAAVPVPFGVQFSLTAVLQGVSLPGPGTPMSSSLGDANLIPLSQPYSHSLFNGTPLDYDGSESAEPGFFLANPDFVDWVLVGLRSDPNGPDLVRRALLLHSDGSVRSGATGTVLTFDVVPGTYHAVVYHRNHLSMMSVAKALSATGSVISLTLPTGVFGGSAAGVLLPSSHFALLAGDGNADGSILAPDRQSVWLPQVGQTGYLQGDFNLDGSVLADDRQTLWAPNVGRQSNVPGASARPSGEVAVER